MNNLHLCSVYIFIEFQFHIANSHMHVADVVYNVYENEIYGMTSHLKTNVKKMSFIV